MNKWALGMPRLINKKANKIYSAFEQFNLKFLEKIKFQRSNGSTLLFRTESNLIEEI